MNKKEFSRIAVIGAGSWGTALGNLLAESGKKVDLWVREKEVFEEIKRQRVNRTFLPDVKLSSVLNPVTSLKEALFEKDLVVLAIPSHVFREVITGLRPYLHSDACLMAATKGIENESLMLMSEVTEEVLGRKSLTGLACLAGPSFASEVSRKLPTAVTIASHDIAYAEKLQKVFNRDFFRVYVSDDLLGAQLGGAMKNVIAIAAGVCDGLGFGHNARAALITRGLAEITRLGVSIGCNAHTFAGLAGLGDLVLTCTSGLSRNRTVGYRIGKGENLEEITEGMKMVAEGVRTTRSAYQLGRRNEVVMPITHEMYRILYEEKNPKEAGRDLMMRDLKVEMENRDFGTCSGNA